MDSDRSCFLRFFFLDFDLHITHYPPSPGEYCLQGQLNPDHLGSYIALFFLLFSMVNIIALGVKGFRSTGLIRKKMILTSLGLLVMDLSMIGYAFVPFGLPYFILTFIRNCGYVPIYLGLKEGSVETKKKPKKEVKVEGGLFRLAESRPDNITEEEVSISKEKKVCLVCKGKIGRLNFMCPECGALYCVKCSDALSDLENQCWACNTPIDPSKPSKPLEQEKEAEVDLVVEEISPKKVGGDKK